MKVGESKLGLDYRIVHKIKCPFEGGHASKVIWKRGPSKVCEPKCKETATGLLKAKTNLLVKKLQVWV